METPFERNVPAVSQAEQLLLSRKKVLVIGCGGLGGYMIEYLTRLGIGDITAVDGDVFETSNLNRQLNSTPALIGSSKATAAAERVKTISPGTCITPVQAFFDETNAEELIQDQDLVIDALDNLSSRFLMEDVCEKQRVPFVHGAILGWSMQITTGLPGKRVLHKIYGTSQEQSRIDASCKTSLAMTPAACAAIQATEALKLLTGHEPSLSGRLLIFNLKTMEQLMIPVK